MNVGNEGPRVTDSREQGDLMDAHMYPQVGLTQADHPDGWLKWNNDHTHGFLDQSDDGDFPRKPFNTGEFNYQTVISTGPGWDDELEKIFHNYDVSFHNEIWSAAFSGSFAAGMTWHWERVFCWPNSVDHIPVDVSDQQYFANNPNGFTSELGDSNVLNIGGAPKTVVHRRLHHHFKPLADLLAHPSWQDYHFFQNDFSAHSVYDDTDVNELEAYYLKDLSNTLAIGWVHNRNAWMMNSYYRTFAHQNFLGCDPPSSSTITLTGFATGIPYCVTWFPTRTNSPVYPPQMPAVMSDSAGNLELDLDGYFAGIEDNYLDTLRSDYAFIVTPALFDKSRQPTTVEERATVSEWDFTLYPNPTRDEVFVVLPSAGPKDIAILDVTGRRVVSRNSVSETVSRLDTGGLAMGAYWILVADGNHTKSKKLIIH